MKFGDELPADKIRRAKQDAESRIYLSVHLALKDLEAETGAAVVGLDAAFEDITTMGSPRPELHFTGVNIKLNL